MLFLVGLFLTSLMNASEEKGPSVAIEYVDAVAYNLGDWTIEVSECGPA